MMYKTIYVNRLHKTVRQVNWRKAAKHYNAGKTVYMLPSNCNPNGFLYPLCPVTDDGREFCFRISEYRYYNCDRERGYRVLYFVDV